MTTADGNMQRLYLDHVEQLTHYQAHERGSRVDWERVTYIVNRFPDAVYIRERSGLLTRLEPRLESTAFKADHLFICEGIECTPDVKAEYIRQARNTPVTMRQYAHRAVLSNWTSENLPLSQTKSRYSVEVFSDLSLQKLEEHNGIVYLEDHDLVVMYGLREEEMKRIYHPYSKQGHTQNSFQTVTADNPHIRKGDFTLNIRIVDNSETFGSRWVLIEDQAYCIVACRDERVADGIYYTYSKNLLNGTGPQKLLSDRFDLDDGDKKLPYKLYRTQQEALQNRRSIQLQELEAKATTAENGLLKAKQERDNLEREAEIRQVKYRQDLDKLQREQQRMIMEHELYLQRNVGESIVSNRKNTMELIKCVPVFITIATALTAMFKK